MIFNQISLVMCDKQVTAECVLKCICPPKETKKEQLS